MDPPHTRAEPISEAHGTSVKIFLRRGRKHHSKRGKGNKTE